MELHTFKADDTGLPVEIREFDNEHGDHVLEIKISKQLVDVMKNTIPKKKGIHVSVEDSIFHTAIGNLIGFYLTSKTNFIKLTQSIAILHKITAQVCHEKLEQAIDCLVEQEDAKVKGEEH